MDNGENYDDSDSPESVRVVSDRIWGGTSPSAVDTMPPELRRPQPKAPRPIVYRAGAAHPFQPRQQPGFGPDMAGMGQPPPYQITGEAQLTLEEKKFLLAVERGDLATVRRNLDLVIKTNYININCVDPLGRSALLMAIDNENLEMVELLIQYKVETKDALLHAINEQYVEAVEVLLDHEEVIHKPNTPHSWEALDPDAATFTPDVTPLILAAHKDNYEIIKILLDRGAVLPMAHDVRCGCPDCVTSRQEDSLRHSRSRINAYRALASPSLIALSSKDPILTAFELSWELRRLSFLEHEFKNEYQELRKQCQNFATALLDHTRSSYELEVMLNHDPTGPAFEHGERMQLNRLKLAIKYKQKKFVAHSNVQQLLASIWYDGLPGFRRKNIVFQTLQIVWIGFLFPLYSFVYILFPHTNLGQTLRKPFIKFICHSASYVTFLFLLILASQRIETVITSWLDFEDEAHNTTGSTPTEIDQTTRRGAPPTIIECMILAWVFGQIWAEIKQLWEDGLTEYIGDMWNIIDFITNSLYVATIALRGVAYYQVQKEIAAGLETAFQAREHWDDWDPMLISEGLFSAANIFSSLKLVYIFSVNPHLGPLQISLGRMVIDIIKFFFIYSLVLFAFACGMNQLLWYYADTDKKHCEMDGTETCYRWRRFANLFESSQTLFWAVFGLIDLNNFELEGIKSYTRFWGMLMFGSYSVINVVVLLNLLIAMMNHSYQLISDRTDIEWKFARSKLWISYFEEGGTVPPPFNIIPTPKSVYYLFRWFFRKIYSRSRAAKKEHMRTIRKKARQANERDFRYQGIMRNLVRRYVTVEQRKADNQGVTEDDVNEIKQDISSFRYELVEILKNSGMNTSSAQENPQCIGPGGKKGRLKERRLMKGFNIGRAESFPITGDLSSMAAAATEVMLTPGPASAGSDSPFAAAASLKSPAGKLRRAAKQASGGTTAPTKSSRRRWGNLVDAARTVKHTLSRSVSQDSFGGSQSSLGQGSLTSGAPNGGGGTDTFGGIPTIAEHHSRRNPPGTGVGSCFSSSEGGAPSGHHRRMATLRSRLTSLSHFPSRLKVPKFSAVASDGDEEAGGDTYIGPCGGGGAAVRRHLYGGHKFHTGSLKTFAKRTSGPMFASQRLVVTKTTPATTATTLGVSPASLRHHHLQGGSSSSSGSSQRHLSTGERQLTPIPSQPSSSNRSSPDVTPPSSPPQVCSATSFLSVTLVPPGTAASGLTLPITHVASPATPRGHPYVRRTSSTQPPPPVPSSGPFSSSPESGGTLTESCSQEPLVGQRSSSPKPSNGSAVMAKLPGIQPIGRPSPSGWL